MSNSPRKESYGELKIKVAKLEHEKKKRIQEFYSEVEEVVRAQCALEGILDLINGIPHGVIVTIENGGADGEDALDGLREHVRRILREVNLYSMELGLPQSSPPTKSQLTSQIFADLMNLAKKEDDDTVIFD